MIINLFFILVNDKHKKYIYLFGIVIYNKFKGGENMNVELMKNRRKELGMTQQDLADKCGLSKNTIYNYENGRVEPTTENLEVLSKELNLSIFELISSINTDKNINDFDFISKEMERKAISIISHSLSKDKNLIDFDSDNSAKELINLISDYLGFGIYYSEKFEKFLFVDDLNNKIYPVDKMVLIFLIKNILSTISTFDNTISKDNISVYGFNKLKMFESEVEFLEKKQKKDSDFIKKCKNNVTEGTREYKTKKLIDENGKTIEMFYERINNKKITEKSKEFKQNKEGGSDE